MIVSCHARNFSNTLHRELFVNWCNFGNKVGFSKLSAKPKQNHNRLVVSCKRKEYDHYYGQSYKGLSEVTLASKGWNNTKSKGDHFVIHPTIDEFADEPRLQVDDLELDAPLIQSLKSQGFLQVTGFQNRAITTIANGNNAMVAAETGCGKTLAYLLPIINELGKLHVAGHPNTPRGLIVTPNRELTLQIGSVAVPLAEAVGLKTKVIVGGHTKKMIMNPEFGDVDLLISTPGALGKLSNTGIYHLNQVAHTVLDEADTLIDDSFMDRIGPIMLKVPQSQVVFVSATVPRIIPQQLESITQTMVHVTSSLLHKPLHNITQRFLRLTRSTKPAYILQIAKFSTQPLLIFTNRNQTCKWLAMFLRENGIECSNMSGDMAYHLRQEQWGNFVRGKVNVLSATDVGSRGLDTTQVNHVVNYDFPLYAADYLHRIGRTGRFGSPEACRATNFITGPEEVQLVQEIELAVRKNQALTNVDGNITKMLQKKILRSMNERSEV